MPGERLRLPAADSRQRLPWLINLRWIACAGLAGVIGLVRYGLGWDLPFGALVLANAMLAVLNSCYLAWFWSVRSQRGMGLLIKTQIFLDLAMLAGLLHFSGGFENPFTLFFVFHMVIASILLSRRAAYLAATFSVALFGAVAAAERLGLLAHHHLSGLYTREPYLSSAAYLPGMFLALAATLYIVVYMSTSIVSRLRERESELAAANRDLEQKDRAKSLYVQKVTHDLRGSLAAIQSCLEVVLGGMTGPVSERPVAMIGRASRRSRALLRFVDELHYLSTIRADRPVIRESVDLRGVVDRAAAGLRPALEEKEMELALFPSPGPAIVRGDPESLERLLAILLDNAVRYTPPGGRVEVFLDEDAGQVRVSVADNGPGIGSADLPHVFEDFYTGRNARDVEPSGTGLGLAIAREIADAHGGTIRVESKEEQGTSVLVVLPKDARLSVRGDARPVGGA